MWWKIFLLISPSPQHSIWCLKTLTRFRSSWLRVTKRERERYSWSYYHLGTNGIKSASHGTTSMHKVPKILVRCNVARSQPRQPGKTIYRFSAQAILHFPTLFGQMYCLVMYIFNKSFACHQNLTVLVLAMMHTSCVGNTSAMHAHFRAIIIRLLYSLRMSAGFDNKPDSAEITVKPI